ncbi:MAG TPA: hypothetical protein VLA09_05710 [Longimicrobiales bacterium]|nr:hypothetical protein [Longimicrobiales bacterium]
MTSVIYALGVAQILSGVSRLASAGGAVRTFAAHTLWVLILFTSIFLVWWATWEFREVPWTFPRYSYLLLAPILLYFACSLVMPRPFGERDVDLEAHFFRVRRPLMWTFLVFTVVVVLDGPLLGTEPLLHPVRIWHAAWFLAAGLGARSRGRRTHIAIAAVILSTSAALVATRFWSLS